jgi:nucleoside-diphosphate-sugar epimerase
MKNGKVMRVFITGASGFVGSAVAAKLIDDGHEVTGLARSEKSAAALEAAGVAALRGDLTDLASLTAGASAADGVIHCGFIHDFANFANSIEVDQGAIETMGAVLAGSGRPFLVTSGIGLLRQGRLGTEEDSVDDSVHRHVPRMSETASLPLAGQGVRVSVIRLPASVHGEGDHGFVPMLIDIARRTGAAAYVEAGENRWPAVAREDAARVYALALEKGVAGARYHAVGEEGIAFRDIATVIGQKLGVPVISVPRDKAAEHFGWMAIFAQMDIPASSRWTGERLGWQPTGPGLFEDMERSYFVGS